MIEVRKIQGKVPFTIILPTYLPNDIGPQPYLVQGPFKMNGETLLVKIGYQKRGSDNDTFKGIFIEEQNSSFYTNTDSESHPERTYLNFRGTKVHEEETEAVPYPPGDPVAHGFRYFWNRDGVDFHIDIFGYSKDECRKVIESMIK